jgi:pimeloyl-ACP methyl ester carboxylesterase
MINEPHHTVVPQVALGEIVKWLTDVVGSPGALTRPSATLSRVAGEGLVPRVRTEQVVAGDVRERLIGDAALFGIISEPVRPTRTAAVTMLLPNGGSTHHVGPNRLYVFIARALSRAGFRVLRFDLPGLGDSIIEDASRENHPYIAAQPAALAAAIALLKKQGAPDSFVLIGLCSGAYASLHSALQLADEPIVESILINPLTFYWEEGMPLDVPLAVAEFDKWQWYMKSIRNPERWAKLFRGDVDVRSLARTVFERARGKFAALRPPPRDESTAARADLERDLTRIVESGRKLTFLFSRFDPGFDLLMANAGRAVKRFRRQGLIDIWRAEAATHTFEEKRSRDLMIDSLVRHAAERYLV